MELVWSFHSNFKPSYICNIYICVYVYIYVFIYKSMSYVLHVYLSELKCLICSSFFPAPGLQLPQVERIEPAA